MYRLKSDIAIYTGTMDVLSYEDKGGADTEIYLWYKKYRGISKAIPVPLYYWKILYNQSTNQGIAFLGLNNPHSEDVTDYLCPNICGQIPWVKEYVPDIDLEEKGHMTCCAIGDLAKLVSVVGTFEDKDGQFIKDAPLLKIVPE